MTRDMRVPMPMNGGDAKLFHPMAHLALVWSVTAFVVSIVLAPSLATAQLDRTKPPALGPAPEVKLPPVTVRQLPNGLRVMVVERHRLPIADFMLIVPTGASANPADKAGLAGLA